MRRFWIASFAIASSLFFAAFSHACSCIQLGPVCSIQLGESTIFRGTVLDISLIPNEYDARRPDGTPIHLIGNGTYKVRFAVEETFSGTPGSEAVIYTAQQSSACGFPFQTGREYVVFGYDNKGELWTSKCSRTALLEPGVDNEAVNWMRAHSKAPHGAEIFGNVHLPYDSPLKTVPATLHLSGPEGDPDEHTFTTDRTGHFLARSLQPGDYTLTADVPQGFTTAPAQHLTVADKGCAQADLYVTYNGSIQGHVVDANNQPVTDLQLHLEHATTDPNTYSRMDYATTDHNGNYTFERLSPGDYFVSVHDPGFLTEDGASTIYYPHAPKDSAQPITLGASATVDGINFTLGRLKPTLPVLVKVIFPDHSSAPAGLYLWAFHNPSAGNEPFRTALTDSSGIATLPLLPGQVYSITVSLDANHPGCGNIALTAIQNQPPATLTITTPEACRK